MRRFLKFLYTLFYKVKYIRKCKIHAFSNIVLRKCDFEGRNVLSPGTYLSHSSLKYASFIGSHSELSNCVVGKYSSIGNYVRVISATHPTSMVSTHPLFYSQTFKKAYENNGRFIEHLQTNNGYDCEIGNDVWIGDNVLIKGGVKIGDGAVVGMGSIVLKDVPPYSIVAGVPARVIRNRFNDELINKLLKFQWWNMPIEWIKKHSVLFENPEMFLMIIDKEKDKNE